MKQILQLIIFLMLITTSTVYALNCPKRVYCSADEFSSCVLLSLDWVYGTQSGPILKGFYSFYEASADASSVPDGQRKNAACVYGHDNSGGSILILKSATKNVVAGTGDWKNSTSRENR